MAKSKADPLAAARARVAALEAKSSRKAQIKAAMDRIAAEKSRIAKMRSGK